MIGQTQYDSRKQCGLRKRKRGESNRTTQTHQNHRPHQRSPSSPPFHFFAPVDSTAIYPISPEFHRRQNQTDLLPPLPFAPNTIGRYHDYKFESHIHKLSLLEVSLAPFVKPTIYSGIFLAAPLYTAGGIIDIASLVLTVQTRKLSSIAQFVSNGKVDHELTKIPWRATKELRDIGFTVGVFVGGAVCFVPAIANTMANYVTRKVEKKADNHEIKYALEKMLLTRNDVLFEKFCAIRMQYEQKKSIRSSSNSKELMRQLKYFTSFSLRQHRDSNTDFTLVIDHICYFLADKKNTGSKLYNILLEHILDI